MMANRQMGIEEKTLNEFEQLQKHSILPSIINCPIAFSISSSNMVQISELQFSINSRYIKANMYNTKKKQTQRVEFIHNHNTEI